MSPVDVAHQRHRGRIRALKVEVERLGFSVARHRAHVQATVIAVGAGVDHRPGSTVDRDLAALLVVRTVVLARPDLGITLDQPAESEREHLIAPDVPVALHGGLEGVSRSARQGDRRPHIDSVETFEVLMHHHRIVGAVAQEQDQVVAAEQVHALDDTVGQDDLGLAARSAQSVERLRPGRRVAHRVRDADAERIQVPARLVGGAHPERLQGDQTTGRTGE